MRGLGWLSWFLVLWINQPCLDGSIYNEPKWTVALPTGEAKEAHLCTRQRTIKINVMIAADSI
jgi:hypothetical protein